MKLRFDDKVAVITGGATGIGAATAGLLVDLGAAVAILDRNEDLGAKTADSLRQTGGRAQFIACDVTNESSVESAIGTVARSKTTRSRKRRLLRAMAFVPGSMSSTWSAAARSMA